MAGISEDIKSLYCGKGACSRHVILFGICVLYAIGSYLLKKHIILDIFFGIFISGYAVSYLHNVMHMNTESLPELTDFHWKNAFGIFGLGILWACYFIIPTGILMSLIFLLLIIFFPQTDIKILGVLTLFLSGLAALPCYLVYSLLFIAYSDKLSANRLKNPLVMLKLLRSFVQVFIVWIKYLLFCFGTVIAYSCIYGLSFFVIGSNLNAAIIINIFTGVFFIPLLYFINVTMLFSYPKSLISIYETEVKPWLYGENKNSDTINP